MSQSELLESSVNYETDAQTYVEPLRVPLESAVTVEGLSLPEGTVDIKDLPRAGDESGEGAGCIYPGCMKNGKCTILQCG